MNKKCKLVSVALLLFGSLILSACTSTKVSMEHVHGLGYTSDGKQVIIPAHAGLVTYSEGKWHNVDAPKHDYMGFVTVDNGFYSSGHPAPGSDLNNPLGIVKSSDMGKTITTLDVEGVSDFHLMTAGYKSHAIYIFNEHPTAKMKSMGLYYTKDEAKTWNKSEMNGFSGEPLSLAAHPTDDKVIAMGTKDGVYVSNDSGNRFEKVLPQSVVTSLLFSDSGDLLVATANSPVMLQLNLSTKDKKEIELPAMGQNDAVSYMSQNPNDPNEIVMATFLKDVFMSKDFGVSWSKIADRGNGK